ncbi:hypothetical protein C8Q73DRAFT_236370 [Cubamyces lactineus]|nr:hypothetical protein C8Q73DRAFT_236370 [Cubamyces lactineus]
MQHRDTDRRGDRVCSAASPNGVESPCSSSAGPSSPSATSASGSVSSVSLSSTQSLATTTDASSSSATATARSSSSTMDSSSISSPTLSTLSSSLSSVPSNQSTPVTDVTTTTTAVSSVANSEISKNSPTSSVSSTLSSRSVDDTRATASPTVYDEHSTSISTNNIQSSALSNANSSSNTHTRTSNSTGAIVGGVLGGIALLLVFVIAIGLLRRRMRARRTAPSAEFMDIMRNGRLGVGLGAGGSGGALSPVKRDGGSTTPGLEYYSDAVGLTGGIGLGNERLMFPLVRRSSLDSDEPPPAFTPGSYKDPVLEKAHAAAEMREHYFRRESLATMAGAEALGVDGRESESGHDGHGHTMDSEKAEFAWAI